MIGQLSMGFSQGFVIQLKLLKGSYIREILKYVIINKADK